MTNHSKLHPGEFSRDIAKWHRGVIADIKQLTRGITRGNQVYLPQMVLGPRPQKVIRVNACQAPENMKMKDDSWVCWKDSSGQLAESKLKGQTRSIRMEAFPLSQKIKTQCNAMGAGPPSRPTYF